MSKKYTLRESQKKMIEFLSAPWHGQCADGSQYAFIFHMMREGKTLGILHWINEFFKERIKILVICRPNTIERPWKTEANLIDWKIWDTCLNMEFISHDSLHTLPIHAVYDLIIVDEVHAFRAAGKETLRYEQLTQVSKRSQYRIGMTGTPFDQYMSELYRTLQWASQETFWGRTVTKEQFESTYCECINPRSKYRKWDIKPHLKKTVMGELKKVAHFYKSGDILLPKFHTVEYPLMPEQKRLIADITAKRTIPEIADVQSDFSAAVRLDKIRQLYSGFLLHTRTSTVVRETTTHKWDSLATLLRDLEFNRIMIFYHYRAEQQHIYKTLRSYRIAKPRYADLNNKSLDRFNRGQLDILIGHPRSCGVGIDISMANHAVFVSHTPSFIDSYQSFYRLSKKGAEMTHKTCLLYTSPSPRD